MYFVVAVRHDGDDEEEGNDDQDEGERLLERLDGLFGTGCVVAC